MCVWRLGQIRITGEGDFENVRVERDPVLREFPEDPPLDEMVSNGVASDDDARAVIRELWLNMTAFSARTTAPQSCRPNFRRLAGSERGSSSRN